MLCRTQSCVLYVPGGEKNNNNISLLQLDILHPEIREMKCPLKIHNSHQACVHHS